MRQEQGMSNAAYVLMGMAAGVTLATLFTPRSGKETREKIHDAMDTAQGKMHDAARSVTQKAKQVSSAARSKADQATDTIGKTEESVTNQGGK